MLINESPKSILIVWENAMETKGLLRFRQPLQEGVDHRVKLLCLTVHMRPKKDFQTCLLVESSLPLNGKKKVLNLNWFIISIIPIKKIKIHGAAFYKCKKTSNPSKRPTWRIIHHFNNLMWDEWQPIIHSSWKEDSNSTFTGRLENLPLLSHLNSLGRSWAGSRPTQWCSKDSLPMTILAETQEPCGPSEQQFLLGVQDLCQHTQQL